MSYGLTLPHPYEKTVFIYFPPFYYHNNFFSTYFQFVTLAFILTQKR